MLRHELRLRHVLERCVANPDANCERRRSGLRCDCFAARRGDAVLCGLSSSAAAQLSGYPVQVHDAAAAKKKAAQIIGLRELPPRARISGLAIGRFSALILLSRSISSRAARLSEEEMTIDSQQAN